tara:strand:+ start:375 stop:731 length:357 start_codon:yes stop_codon:yes gene_type:complete
MSTNAYGWGFMSNMVGTTVGAAGSVQVRVDNTTLNGDAGFLYNISTGIVSISKDLVIDGLSVGVGNMITVPAGMRQSYHQNSRNVVYTDDDDTITIESTGTLEIRDGAIVKMKRYSAL